MNNIYWYAKDGHPRWNKPKQDLGTNAYGFGFFLLNYPNETDKKKYTEAFRNNLIPKGLNGQYLGLGGGIGIHGTNDPDSIGHPASNGCIRLLNEDLQAIADYLDLGSYVYIEN